MSYVLSIIVFVLCFTVGAQEVFASTSVFYIKKSLMMKNDENPQHDYYINAGTEAGLKKGMVIKVHRKVPFQDTGVIKLTEQLEVPVVELKLIHVQGKLSVGRIHKNLIDRNSPVLDYSTVMLGDSVNLGSKRWPRKGEKSVSTTKKYRTQKKVVKKNIVEKKEGQASFSSVAPQEKPEAKEQRTAPKAPTQDQRAESLPIGGEFSPSTL